MSWLGLYAAAAFVVGAALFVCAEFQRAPGTPALRRPGTWALAAGVLWPVLLIAVAQCGVLLALGRRLGRATVGSGDRPTRIAQPVR